VGDPWPSGAATAAAGGPHGATTGDGQGWARIGDGRRKAARRIEDVTGSLGQGSEDAPSPGRRLSGRSLEERHRCPSRGQGGGGPYHETTCSKMKRGRHAGRSSDERLLNPTDPFDCQR